jgi:hypothetical protein
MAHFKELSRHISGHTEENSEEVSQSSRPPS